jgi:uncharacterized repeat protein (TIGR03806 family)
LLFKFIIFEEDNMKQSYILKNLFLFTLFVTLFSCGTDEDDYEPISPVVVDLSQVPYPKLSDYKFFEGDLKNQAPAYKVIPFKPASELFTNYAHKKRFVWMPEGTTANYDGDDNVFDFPVGAVLIKTFYYENVQPANVTKIIETRILIRQNDGWKAHNYIWNNEQTEAFLDTDGNGIFIPVTWKENNEIKTVNYKTPSQTECITCHKINPLQTIGGEITIPIGPKPQNLNTDFNYGTSVRNQIQKWKSIGYLASDVSTNIPRSIVDWKDTSKSLEQRARSYLDINCAHCHRTGGHCDYVNMRLNYSNTDLLSFGLCMTPLFSNVPGTHVITGGNADDSELVYRISSNEESKMMPIIGRSVVHQEGVQLVREWINSIDNNCH